MLVGLGVGTPTWNFTSINLTPDLLRVESKLSTDFAHLLSDLIVVPSSVALPLYGPVAQDPPLGCPQNRRFWKFPFEMPKSHDHLTDMRQGQRI